MVSFWISLISQENEARRQANVVKNIAMNPIKYSQPIVHSSPMQYQTQQKKQKPQQQQQQQLGHAPVPKAYIYTEIENRPPLNANIPHPPLQTVYPAAIQNNIKSHIIHRPALVSQYSSSPIPSSLPSIVHEPSNTVATIQNVPSSFNAQSYLSSSSSSLLSPVLASPTSSSSSLSSSSSSTSSSSSAYTSKNSELYSHQNGDTREKVIVKVVKAPGWYLNDANERRSYFDAVAHGLLSDNGLVYVNNIQKENPANNAQVHPPIGTANARPNVAYLPNSYVPALPSIYQTARGSQPFNFVNYCPCAPTASTAAKQHQHQAQTRQLSFRKRSATNDGDTSDPYNGPSSYNVGLQSVGRLVGDNLKYEYNLSSLRQTSPQQSPRPYSLQRQPSQKRDR